MYYLQTARTGPEARRVFSRIGWALTALLGIMLGGQVLLLAPVMLLAPTLLEREWVPGLLAAVVSYGAAFPAALAILGTLPAAEPVPVRPLPGKKDMARFLLMCLGGMYIANVITLFVMNLLELLRGAVSLNPVDSMQAQPLWVTLLTACVLAPILEELVFRGAVLRRLRPFGDRFAMAASALLFSLMHTNLYQMLYAFVLGYFFAWLILRTGRLTATMLLHAVINFIGAGLLPLLQRLGTAPLALAGLLVLACMICGGIRAVQWHVEVKRTYPRGPQGMWKGFLLNPGMLVFLAVTALLTALIFLA